MGLLDSVKKRWDSWRNLLTGVAAGGGRTNFQFLFDVRLDDVLLENLYYGDAYAARICNCVPQEALRQRFRLTAPSSDDAALAGVTSKLDLLLAREKLVEAWTWARLWGGSALFLGVDDGREPQDPIDTENVSTFASLTVLDKRELYPIEWYTDPNSPAFGEPRIYILQRLAGTVSEVHPVHASRLIRFDGALTNRRRRAMNAGWSESELQRVYTTLQQFNGAYAAVANLLQDASQGVFKIKDLFALMAADATDALKKRLELMDMARGSARAIMVDADSESFERVSTQLTGVPDTLDRFLSLLAGAAEIPVTVLMGQAPAGLNATGDSDIRLYYDKVRAAQSNYLEPKIRRLVRTITQAKDGPTGGKPLAGLQIAFPPLWQQTPKEEGDQRKQQADADVAYITAGVLTSEEVAVSRFRPEGWSPDTTIDLDARQKAIELDKQTAALPKPAPTAAPPPTNGAANSHGP